MKNAQPILFGVYGYSGSGKTTLIEKVVCALQERNKQVAVIKQSQQEKSIDQAGKDTQRFRLAGAHPVVFMGISETVIFEKQRELDDIITEIVEKHQVDIILIEGAYDAKIPKLRIGDIPPRENTLMTFDGDLEKFIQLILKGDYK